MEKCEGDGSVGQAVVGLLCKELNVERDLALAGALNASGPILKTLN
jgi:hypothetical protein